MVRQKKLLLCCADSSVIIMSFILDDGISVKREGTVAEIESEIAKASMAFPQDRMPIISWKEIDDSEIPKRTFRNAWIVKDGKIDHDMTKARNIHRNNLRIIRQKELDILDHQYMEADEHDDIELKKNIAARKKILRDITNHPDIEKAQTIDELELAAISDLIK